MIQLDKDELRSPVIGRSEPDLSPQKHKLLQLLLKKKQDQPNGAAIESVSASGQTDFPVSAAQRRFWVLERLTTGCGAYTIDKAVRLKGSLDLSALERTLTEIHRRHQSLRTTFDFTDGDLRQIIHSPRQVRVSLQDLRHLGSTEQEEKVRILAEAETVRPFDLRNGPLLRVQLLLLAPDEYVMLLAMHHIVSDGWSIGVFFKELAMLYEAFRSDTGPPLPELKIQYADFAVWQRNYLSGEEGMRQHLYWKNKLQGLPPSLQLPTDRPRPSVRSMRGAMESMVLSAKLREALLGLARETKATLFMVLLSAFNALLFRYTNQEDLAVGCPIANRRNTETEALIGAFVNTLVFRAKLTLGSSVRELISQMRAAALEAYANQDVPFEELVADLNPDRALNEQPLFQILFMLRNEPVQTIKLPDVELSFLPHTRISTPFDLSFSIHEVADQLSCWMLYDTDLFDAPSVQRMLGHFHNALESIVRDPDQRIGAIDLLGPKERHQIVTEWNYTSTSYVKRYVHELFEDQAARTPDVIAVDCEGQQLTYKELDRRSNQVARYLKGLGAGTQARVGIGMERSLEMVIGLLGVLKAGAAYVPLDPGYPAKRLKFMAEDAQVQVLLTQERLLKSFPVQGAQVIQIDAEGVIAGQSDRKVTVELADQDLAYVIYTSGSTGNPKGAMNTHGGIRNRLLWMQDAYGLTENDRILQKTPFSFDVSVWEFLWPLITGARLVMARPGGHQDASYLVRLVKEAGITTVHFVPSMLQTFLAEAGVHKFTTLRRVICSGEALSVELKEQFLKHQSCELHNLYGPTEAAVDVTFWPCGNIHDAQAVPIGRPIANTQVYVLDEWMNVVPIGVAGELYLCGEGVGRGYWRRPDLTAEKFLPSPFSKEPGERLYRTGDLARWRKPGYLEYLGRVDHQIKIRGYRIELSEIESALMEHPQVCQAAVLAREDVPGEKRLVAYVFPVDAGGAGSKPASEAHEMPATLRAHLATRLPEYMLPAAFVRMDSLPLTPSGKLDRKALPAPQGESYARRAYEAPQNKMEQILAAMWQELLAMERISRHDHFFALGGHSLLAMQMIERLRRFGLRMEIRNVFANPVLKDLAAGLSQYLEIAIPPSQIGPHMTAITPGMLPLIDLTQEDIDRIVERVPGGIANIQDIYALSPLQEGILFHHLLAREGDPYISTTQMIFPDRALLDRFLYGVQQVIERHDILRTGFMWEGLSKPAQVVWRKTELPATEVELDAREGPIAEQLATRFDPRRHRLDLTRAPLLHFAIAYDTEHKRWNLLQRVHHLIGDNTTMGILHAEVSACLNGQSHTLATPQPFRNWVAQARLGVSEEEHARFFQQMLGEVTEPTLPFGLADVHQDGQRIDETRALLPQDLNNRLRVQARRVGVSLASLCHLAWGQVLARSSGSERVVFGTVLFGGMQGGERASRTAGMFINTLPLRLDLDDTGVEAAIRETHARLTELITHEHASLALAQRCSRVAAPHPLFSALLNYRHNLKAAPAGEAAKNANLLADIGLIQSEERNNYPLTLSIDDYGQALELHAQVVHPLSSERVCGYVQQTLESLAAALETDPRKPVRELQILPPTERALLLERWNATQAPYPKHLCIHQMFEEQVRRNPDATAILHEDLSVSYAELNEQANRLAHHLIGMGVKPDDRVAICVERSLPMVVGLLAILKAGGAYVPLDPAYPIERLRLILTDAIPAIVLSDAAGRSALGAEALTGVKLIELDAPQPEWAAFPAVNPNPEVLGLASHHLAYVIYTSGSTGTPKGAMNEHRALINRLTWMQDAYGLNQTDVILQKTSFSFDVSVWEFFWTLATGATLAIAPPGAHKDSSRTIELIRKWNVTTMHFVPSMLVTFLGAMGVEKCTSLRRLICSGEALPSWHVRECQQRLPDVRVYNLYGPTEAAIDVTAWPCPANFEGPIVPIGRPIANTQIYLLDANRQPVPLGATGEIYIGGAGVARGYLNRPDLTDERFVTDPFTSVVGARMYKTGDLARYLPEGDIEYLGRNDFQVKIRGFRIELGEIEAVLLQHSEVREAVAIVREDHPQDKRIVAYLVKIEKNGNLGARELAMYSQQKLPTYMVPSAFVILDSLPLGPNGKLDRRKLPVPEFARPSAGLESASPANELEREIIAAWREVLHLEQIGTNENLFDLGATSLHTVRIQNSLKRRLNRDLDLLELFRFPTVRSLAAHFNRSADYNSIPTENLQPGAVDQGRERLRRQRTRARAAR